MYIRRLTTLSFILFVGLVSGCSSAPPRRSSAQAVVTKQRSQSRKPRKLPRRRALRKLERSLGRFVLARMEHKKAPQKRVSFPDEARQIWLRLLQEVRPLIPSLPAYRLKLLQRKLQREKEYDLIHYTGFPAGLERDIDMLHTDSQRQIQASKRAALRAYHLALGAQDAAERALERALQQSLQHDHAPSYHRRRSRRSRRSRRRYRSLRLPFPVPGYRIGSGYGWRSDPFTRKRRFHSAVDIGAPRGTPIRAVASGVVVGARWMGSCGRAVLLRHDNLRYRKVYTGYCHMYRIKVRRGQRVRRGQIIGLVGSTGRSTSPHLHFFLRINGRTVNPANHLL